MRIIGYSERGIINSLLYEISYSPSAEQVREDLLASVHFPFLKGNGGSLIEATVLVEQSLSDFGNADAIMLLRTDEDQKDEGRKDKGQKAVFLEAKVKPSQTATWLIENEFNRFIAGTTSTVSSSNLFTQLYHKVRFVNALKRGGICELEHGVPFPPSSTLCKRSIGHNVVVKQAANKIQPFLERVRYVAVVPDHPERVAQFFTRILATSAPLGYVEWTTEEYGFLCWSEIDDFCRTHRLANTAQVFEFNRGQIY